MIMVIRVMPPDEAKKRARANLADWKRQKAMAERRKPPEPVLPEKERVPEPEEAVPDPEKHKLSREQRIELNKQIADVFTRWMKGKAPEALLLSELERLVKAGGDIDLRLRNSNQTLLMHVVSRGLRYEGIAIKMIERGADVNARDKDGNSIMGILGDHLIRCAILRTGDSYENRFPLYGLLKSKGAKV